MEAPGPGNRGGESKRRVARPDRDDAVRGNRAPVLVQNFDLEGKVAEGAKDQLPDGIALDYQRALG